MTMYFIRKSGHNESAQRHSREGLNGTERTISFEKLGGVSTVVVYGHLSRRKWKRNGVKVATTAALPKTTGNGPPTFWFSHTWLLLSSPAGSLPPLARDPHVHHPARSFRRAGVYDVVPGMCRCNHARVLSNNFYLVSDLD